MLSRQKLAPNMSLIFPSSHLFFMILGCITLSLLLRSAAWDDQLWFIPVFGPQNMELIPFHLIDFPSIWTKGMTSVKILFLVNSSTNFNYSSYFTSPSLLFHASFDSVLTFVPTMFWSLLLQHTSIPAPPWHLNKVLMNQHLTWTALAFILFLIMHGAVSATISFWLSNFTCVRTTVLNQHKRPGEAG